MARLSTYVKKLRSQELLSFSDWRTKGVVPLVSAGVYCIWEGDEFIYVGMAGRGKTARQLAALKKSVKTAGKAKGLYDRLRSHSGGNRSGDRFCVYVADRCVVPALSAKDRRALAGGARIINGRTKEFIQTRLSFRFVATRDGQEAMDLEDAIKQGRWAWPGKPSWNPA